MRYAALWVAVLAVGCGESIRPGAEWREEAGDEGTEVEIGAAGVVYVTGTTSSSGFSAPLPSGGSSIFTLLVSISGNPDL